MSKVSRREASGDWVAVMDSSTFWAICSGRPVTQYSEGIARELHLFWGLRGQVQDAQVLHVRVGRQRIF